MARDTSDTDRRAYQRPALGDSWATAWDEVVNDQDELVVERGPISSRPSSGDYDDELYYATDQRILWRWDAGASDWKAAAGLGSSSKAVPGTTHVEALEADDATISNKASFSGDVIIEKRKVSLADDEAASFDVSGTKILRVLGSEAGGEEGIFITNFNLVSAAASNNMTTQQSVLNGTDGPDGTLNISRDGNDLYIENRTGQQRTFAIIEERSET